MSKTRHSQLAEALASYLEYLNRPELSEPAQPIKTNWQTDAAKNVDPDEIADLRFERKRIVTPSVDEIMRQVATDDIERNASGAIIRIGRLRFSDGNQTEKAYTYTIDGKLVQYDARMPIGAMLGMRDKTDVQLGGEPNPQDITDSNNHFADMFKTGPHRYKTAGKRRNGKSYTSDESKAILSEAYANTPVLPPITKLPAGLPYGSAKVAESFLGMRKTTSSGGGSHSWEDISTSIVNRDVWAAVLDELSEKDRKVLDVAGKAKNMKNIGSAFGYAGKTAERRGKRLLVAANDNLSAAFKKSAS